MDSTHDVQNLARVRPGDSAWPSEARWNRLRDDLGARLIKVPPSPASSSGAASCELFERLKNPFFIADQVGLTQTSGWVDAWGCAASVYAVVPQATEHVVAAVNFARENNLRLVVKGGGHSYQGTSSAPDSLLIWMREMNNITLHQNFLPQGCEGKQTPQPAVTVEGGATWLSAYDAVTTRGGRYVQGGGCLTVSVAGLIQSGGFGSFSKRYGLAAAGLLEAEVVTADGTVRIANAATNPDLFWGIKGGGGGSLGVVTKVTLKTHDLPKYFGIVSGQISASSDTAFRQLIGETIAFYTESLFNPHWGEQIAFRPDNTVGFKMMFQGLDQQEVENVWAPFVERLAGAEPALSTVDLTFMCMPGRQFWDSDYLANSYASTIVRDDRPSAPTTNIIWAGDERRVGQFIYGYKSAWLPASLLQADRQRHLADALFASTRHREVCLHFNKGLAGAHPSAVAAAKETPMNPAVLDAFALARCSAEGPPAFPGCSGREPDVALARRQAEQVSRAMDELLKVVPRTGSYVAESDFFEPDWQQSFWGPNYPRLAAVKRKYDPAGLFYVHHGVGSEEWSADGFVRLRRP
jgi:hypothetical protein